MGFFCFLFFLYGCHALYCCVAQTECAAGAGERCDMVSVECQRFIPSLGRNDVSIRSFVVCFLASVLSDSCGTLARLTSVSLEFGPFQYSKSEFDTVADYLL